MDDILGNGAAPPAAVTHVALPAIPPFVHDSMVPNGAFLWFRKLKIIFRVYDMDENRKVALALAALDDATFRKVASALLPADIAEYQSWSGLEKVMVKLFDFTESTFAKRYAHFQMEWKGPAHESVPEFVARVRQSVSEFDFNNFGENELGTLTLLMAMKEPALDGLRSQILAVLNKNPKTPLETCSTMLSAALQTQRESRLPEAPAIHYIHHRGQNSSKKEGNGKATYGRNGDKRKSSVSSNESRNSGKSSSSNGCCIRCKGSKEVRKFQYCEKCYHRMKKHNCSKCKRIGHFSEICYEETGRSSYANGNQSYNGNNARGKSTITYLEKKPEAVPHDRFKYLTVQPNILHLSAPDATRKDSETYAHVAAGHRSRCSSNGSMVMPSQDLIVAKQDKKAEDAMESASDSQSPEEWMEPDDAVEMMVTAMESLDGRIMKVSDAQFNELGEIFNKLMEEFSDRQRQIL